MGTSSLQVGLEMRSRFENRWCPKKLDVKVASNPEIPLLGTHPRETEMWVHTKTCTSVFTEPRAPDRLCQARGCHHPT